MTHDKILQYRKNYSPECRIRHAGTGLYLDEGRRGIDPKFWPVTATGIPIPSGSARNQWSGVGYFTVYPNYDQNTRGCCNPTSDVCANQWVDHWRDCGECHRQLSRQVAPPWLIAIGEVMRLNCNMLLTVCMPLNWSRSLPFWFRIGDGVLMNPLD